MDTIIKGVYLREDKHRFICNVSVNGKEEKCYVPASCKLEKLISLVGETVLLTPIKKDGSELRYSLFAVKKRRGWVLLNLARANAVIGENLYKRRFVYLGYRKDIIYERKIGHYKADLFLPKEQTIIEIKTVLTEEAEGIFPGMPSKRAKEQLKNISVLLDCGYKACLIIVALNPKTKRIVIADYLKESLKEVIDKGMLCKGYSIRFKDLNPTIGDEVEIIY